MLLSGMMVKDGCLVGQPVSLLKVGYKCGSQV